MRPVPIGRIYLTEFLFNAITFGVGIQLLSLLFGDGFSFTTILLQSIFFGGIISFFYVSATEEFINDLGLDIMTGEQIREYEKEIIHTPNSLDSIVKKLEINTFTNEMRLSRLSDDIIVKPKKYWSEGIRSIIISKKENGSYQITPKSRNFIHSSNYFKTIHLIRYIKDHVIDQ